MGCPPKNTPISEFPNRFYHLYTNADYLAPRTYPLVPTFMKHYFVLRRDYIVFSLPRQMTRYIGYKLPLDSR
jgi:hypothetical protein